MMGEFSFDELLSLMKTWCASREVCISEAETKLKKRSASEQDSRRITALLLESGYIDEKRYAAAFAGDKMHLDKWGAQKIRQALKAKKIPDNLIAAAIAEKEQDINQDEIVSTLLQKKVAGIKSTNSREIYAKLLRFGLSRGFDYATVSKHASSITKLTIDD